MQWQDIVTEKKTIKRKKTVQEMGTNLLSSKIELVKQTENSPRKVELR